MEPSQREVGKRFRKAVERELGRSGRVASAPSGDWLIYNGTRVALRYSRCEARGVRSKWFYGIVRRDTEGLSEGGALALIMPHPHGHRFALFDQEQTRELLTRCRGSERGDLKIHLRYDDPIDRYRITEWRELELTSNVFALGHKAMSDSEITTAMGVVFFANEPAEDDGNSDDGGEAVGDEADESDNVEGDAIDSLGPATDVGREFVGPAKRTPRPFDPLRVPTLRGGGRLADPEATLVRREQASHAHQQLVKALDAHLRASGWTEIAELPGAIDLWGRRPVDQQRVIFECKSLNRDRLASELARCRTGLAQLLEYRFEYGDPTDALCLVTDGPVSERRVRFLEHVGVGCVAFRDSEIEVVSAYARIILGDSSRAPNAAMPHEAGIPKNGDDNVFAR